MSRPSIKSPCVADRHHSPGERIVEVTYPDGSGCLLSLFTDSEGRARLDVYRADETLLVVVEKGTEVWQKGRRMKAVGGGR